MRYVFFASFCCVNSFQIFIWLTSLHSMPWRQIDIRVCHIWSCICFSFILHFWLREKKNVRGEASSWSCAKKSMAYIWLENWLKFYYLAHLKMFKSCSWWTGMCLRVCIRALESASRLIQVQLQTLFSSLSCNNWILSDQYCVWPNVILKMNWRVQA